jgi:putative membrane protein
MYLILRWILNALALLLVAYIVPGFEVSSFYAALIAALILGLVNALIRPIILVLTLPVTIVTLGLFVFVVNALMLWIVSTIVKGISIDGFVPALMGAVVLWVVGLATNWLIKHAKES